MSIKLIVSDIDYTLINAHAMPTPRHIAEHIGGIRHCICMTGAELYDLQKEQTIFCRTMPNAVLASVIKAVERFSGAYCQLYCEREIVANEYAMNRIKENATAKRYLDTVRDRLITAEDVPLAVEQRGLKGAKFLIIAKEQEQLAPMKAEIAKIPGLSVVFSGSWSIEVMDESVTKGTALKTLREMLGFEREEVLAIGDSENDVAMLAEAGIGVAVGNATRPLLEYAEHIVPPVWDDGAAVAVERFALGEA